jgi:type VI secretion system protein ImpM
VSGDALSAGVGPWPWGWHGKLPCRGDFVGGGAPLPLIEAWRAWALTGGAALRAGGTAARDRFLVAPIWRFAVTPGVFGAGSGIGVTGPGIDAAGRAFPVVIAAAGPVDEPGAALGAAAGWLDRAAASLLAALGSASGPAVIDLPSPPPGASPPPASPSGPRGLFVAEAGGQRVVWSGHADGALYAALYGVAAAPEDGP